MNKDIKNHAGYCMTVAKNSLKNEYRGNDNQLKLAVPCGITPRESADQEQDTDQLDAIGELLSSQSLENWLLFMDNATLHKAIISLPRKDQEFLFEHYVIKLKQDEMAELYGLSQQGVSWRKCCIMKKLKKHF